MWQGGNRSKQHNKVASWGSMMRHQVDTIGQGDEVVIRWGNNLMKQHKAQKDEVEPRWDNKQTKEVEREKKKLKWEWRKVRKKEKSNDKRKKINSLIQIQNLNTKHEKTQNTQPWWTQAKKTQEKKLM